MVNKIVSRFADGKVMKGTTVDFFPNKDIFHMIDRDNGENYTINVLDLKALFFVKDFDGDCNYQDKFDVERVGLGKKIKVCYKDGEMMIGYTQGFSPNRNGFFLFPSDPDCNNEKVFVIMSATRNVDFF